MSDWLLTDEKIKRLILNGGPNCETLADLLRPVAKAQHEKTYPWARLEGMRELVEWLEGQMAETVGFSSVDEMKKQVVMPSYWQALRRWVLEE